MGLKRGRRYDFQLAFGSVRFGFRVWEFGVRGLRLQGLRPRAHNTVIQGTKRVRLFEVLRDSEIWVWNIFVSSKWGAGSGGVELKLLTRKVESEAATPNGEFRDVPQVWAVCFCCPTLRHRDLPVKELKPSASTETSLGPLQLLVSQHLETKVIMLEHQSGI